MKKVGVIIPCYNHEDYIGEAIESIFNQTYKDFDIYVADDASNDRSVNIIEQYEDKIKEFHVFDVNQGGQVKFLVSRVDNMYTALLNSDDFWDSTKLEKQVAYMEANPDCAACFTWAKQVNQNGEQIEGINAFQQHNRTSHEWMLYFYNSGNCLAHPSVLIRTELYRELLKNSYKAFRQLPDYQMWVKLVQTNTIHVIEEPLMSFRWHGKNGTTNVSSASPDNFARHYNEECYMWYETIRDMDKNFFIKAFDSMLINGDASSEEEIKCEKFFVLVRAKEDFTKQAAVFYFYDIYKDIRVQETFESIYDFTKKDFYQLELTLGHAKIYLENIKTKNLMREMGQCIIDANR